jgi:hypothetical protein
MLFEVNRIQAGISKSSQEILKSNQEIFFFKIHSHILIAIIMKVFEREKKREA